MFAPSRVPTVGTIERQFHIFGAARLFPGRGDLLGHIRRHDDLFGERDAVVRQKALLMAVTSGSALTTSATAWIGEMILALR